MGPPHADEEGEAEGAPGGIHRHPPPCPTPRPGRRSPCRPARLGGPPWPTAPRWEVRPSRPTAIQAYDAEAVIASNDAEHPLVTRCRLHGERAMPVMTRDARVRAREAVCRHRTVPPTAIDFGPEPFLRLLPHRRHRAARGRHRRRRRQVDLGVTPARHRGRPTPRPSPSPETPRCPRVGLVLGPAEGRNLAIRFRTPPPSSRRVPGRGGDASDDPAHARSG